MNDRLRTLPLGLVAVASLWLWTTAARADAVPAPKTARLTDRGRLALSGSVGGSWSNDDSALYGTLDHWNAYANPAATYFLRDRIGLGLALSGGASGNSNAYVSYEDYNFAVGMEGAFELPLGPRLGIMLRPFLGYLQQWREQSLTAIGRQGVPIGQVFPSSVSRSLGYVRAWLALQLLIHLSSSIALSLGPDIWADFIVKEDGRRSYELSDEPPARVQLGLSAGVVIAL